MNPETVLSLAPTLLDERKRDAAYHFAEGALNDECSHQYSEPGWCFGGLLNFDEL